MKSKENKEEKEGILASEIESMRKAKSIEPFETREEKTRRESLAAWKPKTRIGMLVKHGKMKDLDEVISKNKILEAEIVDSLVNLKSDFLNIGQSKGKFGGGKRRSWRQTQRKTAEGNVPTFACLCVVGDSKGHVGIGYGKAKETLPARSKAVRKAKINIIKIHRGCGSFDCMCNEKHSIPFITEGKCGSVRTKLIPAPQGTGLVIGDEGKRILKLAGIKDVYSKTFGQTRTTINVAKALMEALTKTKQGNF